MLKENGMSKHKKLDYKCGNRKCKNRYSLVELLELGYAERISNEEIAVECPNCGEREVVKVKR